MDKRPVLIVRMVESIERNGVYRPTCGILQERDANMIIGIYPDGSMKVVKDRRVSYCGTKVKLQLDRQGSEAPIVGTCGCNEGYKCPYHRRVSRASVNPYVALWCDCRSAEDCDGKCRK